MAERFGKRLLFSTHQSIASCSVLHLSCGSSRYALSSSSISTVSSSSASPSSPEASSSESAKNSLAPHGREHHEVDEGRAAWHRFEGGRPSRTRRWRVRGARARVQGAASAESRSRARGGERVRGA